MPLLICQTSIVHFLRFILMIACVCMSRYLYVHQSLITGCTELCSLRVLISSIASIWIDSICTQDLNECVLIETARMLFNSTPHNAFKYIARAYYIAAELQMQSKFNQRSNVCVRWATVEAWAETRCAGHMRRMNTTINELRIYCSFRLMSSAADLRQTHI